MKIIKITKPMTSILIRLLEDEYYKASELFKEAHPSHSGKEVRRRIRCQECNSNIERFIGWDFKEWKKEQEQYVSMLSRMLKQLKHHKKETP